MKTIRFAFSQIIPILASYVFVGLAAGLLMHRAGYTALWSMLAAIFIYAGSMQIVLVSLLSSGAPLFTIALMTLFINGRHIFYGLGFLDRFRSAGKRFPYMVLTTTDETYSVLCSVQYPEGVDGRKADFLILHFCHLCWIISCAAGALIGEVLPFSMAGIEFSATAYFTAVVVNQWRQSASHIPAITGFLSAVAFYFIVGAENFILPALSVSVLVLMALKKRIPEAAR